MRHQVILGVLLFSASLLALAGAGAGTGGDEAPASLPVYDYIHLNSYYHDPDAFTQGLYYKDGYLYEGTGLVGHSTVRKVVPETGQVVKIQDLPPSYYGEGITVRGDTVHQLTYRNFSAFTWIETDTFAFVDSFPYPFIGWGLTHDDTSLISSDGSYRLFHLDPQTYQEIRRFNVTLEGALMGSMNEMEYIQGRIWANIYGKDSIAIIVPQTGVVESWVNLEGLRDSIWSGGVLNGIAWDPDNFRLFVTGKKWPLMFEVWTDAVNYPPRITGSSPPPSVCTEVDSTVLLQVSAEDPNFDEALYYVWTINGVIDPSAHDSVYLYSSPVPAVDTVMVEVTDGMLADSTSWLVVVSTAGAPHDAPRGPDTGWLAPPRIQPNPFRRSTTICFDVPCAPGSSGRVELAIHDVQGREVRTLVRSRLGPGSHEAVWHRRDNAGGRVAAGLYMCTLSMGGRSVSRKIAVID